MTDETANKKVWPEYIWVYVFLATVIGFMGSGAILLPDYMLLRHAQVTGGVIIETICKKHATVIYRYEVAGQNWTGQDRPSGGVCGPHLMHTQVKVWYRSDRPEIARLSNPAWILENDGTALALAVITLPTIFVFSAWAKQNARRRSLRYFWVKPVPVVRKS